MWKCPSLSGKHLSLGGRDILPLSLGLVASTRTSSDTKMHLTRCIFALVSTNLINWRHLLDVPLLCGSKISTMHLQSIAWSFIPFSGSPGVYLRCVCWQTTCQNLETFPRKYVNVIKTLYETWKVASVRGWSVGRWVKQILRVYYKSVSKILYLFISRKVQY